MSETVQLAPSVMQDVAANVVVRPVVEDAEKVTPSGAVKLG